MKIFSHMITNTFRTFSVLSIVFGILCKVGILENLPYTQVVFVLFFMALGTTLFVTIREMITQDTVPFKYMVDMVGCSAIILFMSHLMGWLELSLSYFLLIGAMVVTVYLLVWLITYLQSKHDEEDLNRLLMRQPDKQNIYNKKS